MDTVLLEFTAGAPPYRAGDVAGFAPSEARAYLERRVARRLTEPPAPAAQPAAAASEELVLLQFDEACPPYRVGEVAGFSPEKAAQLETPRPGPAGSRLNPFAHRITRAQAAAVAVRTGRDAQPEAPTVVRFLRAAHGYRGGELAGFDADVAAELVKTGVAVDPSQDVGDAAEAAAPQDVDPNVEVVGLDDRDPEWREKAAEGPPAHKMVNEGTATRKNGAGGRR